MIKERRKDMKRYFSIIFIFIVIVMMFSSCNSGKTEQKDTSSSDSAKETLQIGEYVENVYEIETEYCTLKFPSKWQDKLTVTIENNTVYFIHNASKVMVFSIVFGNETQGYLLGTLNTGGKSITVSTIEGNLDESNEYYNELCSICNDINVILNYLHADYNFEI